MSLKTLAIFSRQSSSSDLNSVLVTKVLVTENVYSFRLDCFRKTYRAEGYFGMYRGEYRFKIVDSLSHLTNLFQRELFAFVILLGLNSNAGFSCLLR